LKTTKKSEGFEKGLSKKQSNTSTRFGFNLGKLVSMILVTEFCRNLLEKDVKVTLQEKLIRVS
jgi:hypothetical protein